MINDYVYDLRQIALVAYVSYMKAVVCSKVLQEGYR